MGSRFGGYIVLVCFFCLYIVVQQRLTETQAKLEKCDAEQTELKKRNIELQTSLNHEDASAKVCNRLKVL